MIDLNVVHFIALSVGLAQPTGVVATQEGEDATIEQIGEVEQDQDRIICKKTRLTGSKFTKKICGTEEQWAQLTGRARDNAAEMQRRGKGLDPNGM